MISMVLPTMWKYEPFYHFLDMVLKVPVVQEVHIINNHVERTPNINALNNPKVKMYNQTKNIGVHPAWNMGVANSTADNICIFGDDIIFDLKILFEVDEFLNNSDETVGLVAMDVPYPLISIQTGEVDFVAPEECKRLIQTGIIQFEHSDSVEFGCAGGAMFFLKRKNWVEIPKELVKDFGDRWCWHVQKDLGKKNYSIKNSFFFHAGSKTANCDDKEYNGLQVDYTHESGEGYRELINNWRNQNNLPIMDYPRI